LLFVGLDFRSVAERLGIKAIAYPRLRLSFADFFPFLVDDLLQLSYKSVLSAMIFPLLNTDRNRRRMRPASACSRQRRRIAALWSPDTVTSSSTTSTEGKNAEYEQRQPRAAMNRRAAEWSSTAL
jgi:hypothetical protein